MKRKLCLLVALVLAATTVSCNKVQARMEIKEANDAYYAEDYATALEHYRVARQYDGTFVDLDRLIGYSLIGLYKPNVESKDNEKYADQAILELRKYLKKQPDDEAVREALINLFLNANRTSQAIDFFRERLKTHPNDLSTVRSIATLYAKRGDFKESMNWYKKITLIDSKNAEAFYIYGVVLYEKVSKDPPADAEERLAIVEEGKRALASAIALDEDYFEALVYMNLLFREHSKLVETPEEQAELMEQANEYRNRAVAIARARKAAAEGAADTKS